MLDKFTTITGALLVVALLGCFAWGARWRSAALDAEALHATAEARRRMCAESVEALAQEDIRPGTDVNVQIALRDTVGSVYTLRRTTATAE